MGRSREGAWIEICLSLQKKPARRVAPARERGLKLLKELNTMSEKECRSREGAWIEI